MQVIKFMLIFVLLGTEAIASETSDRVADRNFKRQLDRTESEYRSAEEGYNSIKRQLDKINTEIEGLNKTIENSQRIINQIEMGVFNCDSEDFRDFRQNYRNEGTSLECISYIRNKEKLKIQSLENKIIEFEYKKKPLQEQLVGAKVNLDEKKDGYTVAQENYDAFNKRKEELKENMDAHNTVMQGLEGNKKTAIQSNEQILRDNSGFLSEKPQYKTPRTWRPKE